jgi:hypothetical protein
LSTSTSDPITLAFAGTGDVDLDNIKALLNDWLGFGEDDKEGYPEPSDRDVTLILPITKLHISDGLEVVLEWADYANVPVIAVTDNEKSRAIDKILKNAEETHKAANVTAKIVELLKDAEGEKHVVLLWGEGSEEAELLLDAAEVAGIKAKDLTAGLDDISFTKEEEPTPEPEPEPEPEAPKRRARRGRRAEPEIAEQEEEPLTDDEPEDEKPEPEEPKRRGRRQPEPATEEEQAAAESLEQEVNREAHKAQQKTPPVPEDTVDLLLVRTALEAAHAVFKLEDRKNALINQAVVRYRPLTELLGKALATLGEDPAQEAGYEALAAQQKAVESPEEEEDAPAPRRRRGRPRDEAKTYAYLQDEDGELVRRGRGRIPAGSKVVDLTRAEIAEKGLELPSE